MLSRRSALIVVLVMCAGCRTVRPVEGLPPNFGVVEEGKIYRGAQPDSSDLQGLAKRGVRTILKLNDADLAAETLEAARLGMRVVHTPLSARTAGRPESCAGVELAYSAMVNPHNWPLFVHCTHGRDRTGFLVGMFRERAEGWTFAQVSRELEAYGHNALLRFLFPGISSALSNGHPCAAEAVTASS